MREEFIINWFAEKSTMSKKELEMNLDINYFEQGLIDSFAFLELITACEEKYGVSFSDDDFANDKIFTISGLIEVLEAL